MEAGGRWRPIAAYEQEAETLIKNKHPDLNWSELKEAQAWLNPFGATNSFMFSFDFGLGKNSYLVYFGREGGITNFDEGIAVSGFSPHVNK